MSFINKVIVRPPMDFNPNSGHYYQLRWLEPMLRCIAA